MLALQEIRPTRAEAAVLLSRAVAETEIWKVKFSLENSRDQVPLRTRLTSLRSSQGLARPSQWTCNQCDYNCDSREPSCCKEVPALRGQGIHGNFS